MTAHFLQLFPQPRHIYRQRVLLHIEVALPQAHHQLLPAHDLPPILQQRLQNPKFVFRQLDLPLLRAHAVVAQTQSRPAELHGVSRSGDLVGAPQHRLHLGCEHHGVHGLGDEVVPAHVQCHDDVHVVRRRGEKHHRYRRNLPNPAAPVVSVPVRELNVHQHQLRPAGFKLPYHVRKVRHARHLIAVALQMPAHGLGQRPVVLHQQYPVHTFLLTRA